MSELWARKEETIGAKYPVYLSCMRERETPHFVLLLQGVGRKSPLYYYVQNVFKSFGLQLGRRGGAYESIITLERQE